MRLSRFTCIVRLIVAGVFLSALSSAAVAQPAKTVRILVGFPPGGGTDAIARTLAEKLKDELGTSVIVENRPGAGGQIAAHALKSALGRRLFHFAHHRFPPAVGERTQDSSAKDFVPSRLRYFVKRSRVPATP